MESVRTTIFLPRKSHQQLKALAQKSHLSMARLIQKALEQVYFKKNRKSAKDLWGCIKGEDVSYQEFQKI